MPIPIRLRWTQRLGRLTADSGAIHVLVERAEHLEIAGLPEGLTELDYWAGPDGRGLLRVACGQERELTGDELAACRSHFDAVMQRVAAAAMAFFGLKG